MRREFRVVGESLLTPAEIIIALDQASVPRLALEVSLLVMGLVESLRLHPAKGPAVRLTLLNRDRVTKALVTRLAADSAHFAIGKNQAEFLLVVLLRAFRDQMAETDHVHIEGENSGVAFDLTLMFEVSREPMSPEDAARLMDDD